jgi:signal peptidase I
MKRWLSILTLGLLAIYLYNPAAAAGWSPLARLFGICSYRVPYTWMAPTLVPGDIVLVDIKTYRAKPPAHGDIVVFAYPYDRTRTYLGRVIGVAGDTVAIEDGIVFVNDRPLAEPYRQETPRAPYSLAMTPVTIAAGGLFVLGDNRDHSKDSRIWSALPRRDVVGKVFYRLSADTERFGPVR